MWVETAGFGTKCGCETVREVANGSEIGLWDEKRALKTRLGAKTRRRAARGRKRGGKMALFIVVEYKMLPTCKIGKNNRKRN